MENSYNETIERAIIDTPADNGEVTGLSYEEIMHMANRISGDNIDGLSKGVIGYQFYAMEDPDDSVDKMSTYNITRGSAWLSMSKLNQNFFTLDIKFKGADDPELKFLWGRLQRLKRMETIQPEKTWIFYINILERSSVTNQTYENDKLLICNVFNPTLSYLTREVPDYLCKDNLNEDANEIYGGNIVRMLIPTELVTFEVIDNIDTSEIKGEVMREIADEDYLNNASNNTNSWNENL